jgi:hypothetical protein
MDCKPTHPAAGLLVAAGLLATAILLAGPPAAGDAGTSRAADPDRATPSSGPRRLALPYFSFARGLRGGRA